MTSSRKLTCNLFSQVRAIATRPLQPLRSRPAHWEYVEWLNGRGARRAVEHRGVRFAHGILRALWKRNGSNTTPAAVHSSLGGLSPRGVRQRVGVGRTRTPHHGTRDTTTDLPAPQRCAGVGFQTADAHNGSRRTGPRRRACHQGRIPRITRELSKTQSQEPA